MSTRFTDALGEVRRPEYTGGNRCLPCTVVNVIIGAVLAVGAATLLVTPVGAAVFLVSLLVIYLRGYLVPGTPELTERYFPPWLLSLFGKDAPVENAFVLNGDPTPTAADVDRSETEAGATDDDKGTEHANVSGPLFGAGVVSRREEAVVLDSRFESAWRERIEAIRDREIEPADIAAAFDADEARRTGERSFVLDGTASARWESRASLVADVAGVEVLRERVTDWEGVPKSDRTAILTGLRLFLDRCPVCDGRVERSYDRVDPCCQKPHRVVTATCENCGALIADAAVVDDGTDAPIGVRLLTV